MLRVLLSARLVHAHFSFAVFACYCACLWVACLCVHSQALHTIHGVSVTFTPSSSTTVCTFGSPTTVTVAFAQDFGDLPSLRLVESTLKRSTVAVRGWARMLVCDWVSGKGVPWVDAMTV